MIEIKSINGKVLYVAKDATTQRAGLEEAVGAGAYLAGANLAGAYLDGANLDGAYLDGANLAGAYLDGANLAGATWAVVADTLRSAIQAMNDSGRHWVKGQMSSVLADDTTAYCSIGSVNAQTTDGTPRAIALWLLGSVCAGDIARFNDDPDTTWEDVKAAFAVAIRHAERLSKQS